MSEDQVREDFGKYFQKHEVEFCELVRKDEDKIFSQAKVSCADQVDPESSETCDFRYIT